MPKNVPPTLDPRRRRSAVPSRSIRQDTAPAHAPVGTIRGDYAIESYHMADSLGRPLQNLIHASGAPEEAEREIKIWFKDDEIHAYNRVDEGLIYRKVE